jgi:hypothetical protein
VNLRKELLVIHNLADKFPNSGSLKRALHEYYTAVESLKNIKEKEELRPLISILTDVAYHSPSVYRIFAAILSQLITLLPSNCEKIEVFDKIHKKFSKVPNTGHLDLWLQRISIKLVPEHRYDEPLCKLVSGENTDPIWGINEIDSELQKIIKETKIIDQIAIDNLDEIISADESNISNQYYLN